EIRADDDDGVPAGGLVFVVAKAASECRFNAEYAEVVGRDHHAAPDARGGRRLGAETDGFHGGVGDYAVVTFGLVADVEVFAIGEVVEAAVVRGTHQGDDATRVRHGIGPEDQRIEHAKCARSHADA